MTTPNTPLDSPGGLGSLRGVNDPIRSAARAATARAKAMGAPVERAERLTWAAARDEAPWPARGVKSEQEAAYREAYAQELVRLGAAVGPNNRRASGPSGASGQHRSPRRLVTASAEVFAAIDRAAKDAGVTGNQWILAAVEEKLSRR